MSDIRRIFVLSAAVAVVFLVIPAFTTAPNDLSRWNSDENRRLCNNCYNYATNQPNGSLAQPGWAGGGSNQSPYTCGGVLAGAESDGLTFAGHTLDEARDRCAEDCCLVALINSGYDFHWYREDADGTWSHKPGPFPATNLDASDPPQPITDPTTANHNYGGATDPTRNYDVFCGFMCVCRDRLVELKGKKEPKPIPPTWYGECPTDCVENAPGCLPTGAYSVDPGCCCSCVLRILGVGEYECK